MSRDDVVPGRDAEWLAVALDAWSASRRLALGGRTPTPDLLAEVLGGDVVMQQVAWDDSGRPAGLLQVRNLDDRSGVADLDLLVDPEQAACVRGELAGFLAEVFAAEPLRPLRKLSLWAAEDALDVPACVGPAAVPVGRLVDHERRGPAGHVDMLVYEVWKEPVP